MAARPVVGLEDFELPQASDPILRHVPLCDPGVNAVLRDTEMPGDSVRRHPGLGHASHVSGEAAEVRRDAAAGARSVNGRGAQADSVHVAAVSSWPV